MLVDQLPDEPPVQVFVCALATIDKMHTEKESKNLFIKLKFGDNGL